LGGAERVALTLVAALRDEFDFEIFAVRGLSDGEVGHTLAEEVRQLGLPLHVGARVPMRFGGVITSGIGMACAVKRVKPDLIHLHTEIPETGYAVMAACLPGTRATPVVRTIHNTVFWEFWRPMGRWADRQMPRSFVAGAPAVVKRALTDADFARIAHAAAHYVRRAGEYRKLLSEHHS